MTDKDFCDLVRDKYDSVIVNVLMKLELTDEQKQMVIDELNHWE